MKTVMNSFIIAMAMYSKIPMPKTEWKQENMKYSICFFPVVGVVIGALLYGWSVICGACGFGQVCFALVGAVLPVLVTGGIHVDGFMDTADALHSYAEREKKLEILKDPHIGAFSVIAVISFFLLCVAGLTQVSRREQVELLALSFVLSRTLSGLSLVWFSGAKKDGLLYRFASTAHRRIVRVVLGVLLVLCVPVAVGIQPVTGSVMTLVAVGVWIYYYFMSRKQFGGITGDLAGYFLCLCELVCVLVVGFL
jgi:adenosylcobinamide-GDP ribazoletransferase